MWAKIEGFYEVCRAVGLTGQQGVMFPRDNLRNLVLKDEVVEAVSEGRFHIYAVSTIDEGIEVLTGVPAGQRQQDGGYPEGTVHNLVEERLKEMARRARQFTRSPDNDGRERENDEKDS